MLIIYNPAAGQRRASLVWRVLDHLVGAGVRLELAETQHAGHATELARAAAERGIAQVVAAGGDGTIAEVANGLIGTSTRLGIIPLGTANVLAHELALPFAPRDVAAALAFGRTRRLWPGWVEGAEGQRAFVQMLGVGLDAAVVHNINLPLKRVIGRTAYVLQTVREMLTYDYPPVRLMLDGVAAQAASVIICKGRFYGGSYVLAPEADPGVAGFHVALFERSGTWPALVYGAALPLNLLPRAPGLRLVRAGRIEVTGNRPVAAQADGDPAGFLPLTIRDAPAPVDVVVA